jgi:hypothetical protein
MQAVGSPPQDLVGDIKDVQGAIEGVGNECPQQ